MKLLPAIVMHKKFWIVFCSVLAVIVGSFQVAIVGGTIILVERAVSPQEHAQGLSGRARLADRKGMLFVFEEKGNPTFWMKDMQFPIDILWIADGRVVALDERVKVAPHQDDDALERYTPPIPVDSVLEIGAGNAKKWGVSVGSSIYAW